MSPTWQRTPCPPWCAGGHREDDHPEDRVHRSAGLTVPVVSRRVLSVDPMRYQVVAQEFEVGLSRPDDSATTWLYLGAGPGECVEVSLGSCADLVRALESTVRRAGVVPGAASADDGDASPRPGRDRR
ncbi:MAG: hypothetical protein QM626_00095 [Microbacterium sp.]|uniref:DUF6907 domain-containing protein n=1 Tax=Microbacterium sp. TaxID=51671 RepID=UPI0039E254A0